MPEVGETLRPRSRAAWRKWLERHHQGKSQIWLVLNKKHVTKSGITYDVALEEALCFGWIDGILKRIDDEKHLLRFCPRRPNSIWSDPNKRRVDRLIREGRMTDAGLAAVRAGKRSGKWQQGSQRQLTSSAPEDLQQALAKNPTARRGFASLAPSYRRQYVAWILDAKRAETRRRRVSETIRRAALGKRPGID
jgi:uncharacterized protein YdeI (YjbR/CyaY-like superfamily)